MSYQSISYAYLLCSALFAHKVHAMELLKQPSLIDLRSEIKHALVNELVPGWSLAHPSPLLRTANGNQEPNIQLVMNASGTLVAALNEIGQVMISQLDEKTGWKQQHLLNNSATDGITAQHIAINQTGTLVFISAQSGAVRVEQYEPVLKSWKRYKIVNGFDNHKVEHLAINADGSAIFLVISDGSVYEVTYNQTVHRANQKTKIIEPSQFPESNKSKDFTITSVATDTAGSTLVFGSKTGSVEVTQLNKKTENWHIPLALFKAQSPVVQVAASGDGSTIAIATKDGKLHVTSYDETIGAWLAPALVTTLKDPCIALRVNDDGTQIIVGTSAGTVQMILYETVSDSWKTEEPLFTAPYGTNLLAANKDLTKIAVSHADSSSVDLFIKKA